MVTGSPQPLNVRAISTRSIILGALVVLVFGGAGFFALIFFFGAGTDADRVRIEAVRTAGTIALGTGGAVALLLAARRQQYAELSLRQQTEAMHLTAIDARERRASDLYKGACEQLASDRATIRLAGVYALEKLGGSYIEFRSLVVDLLCAYLRMPFDPPSWFPEVGPPVRFDDEDDRTPSLNAESDPILAQQLDRERSQELEVRYAVQNILISKLTRSRSDDDTWTSGDVGFYLNLERATLMQFTAIRLDVTDANFGKAKFFGNTVLTSSRFRGYANFEEAEFRGIAWISGVRFRDRANFIHTQFRWPATFKASRFRGMAFFRGANFEADAIFEGAVFSNRFDATRAKFLKGMDFSKTRFKLPDEVVFERAEVHPPANGEPITPPVDWIAQSISDSSESSLTFGLSRSGKFESTPDGPCNPEEPPDA